MIDIEKLLDGTVEVVKSRLVGLDTATLGLVLAAEQAGKKRKGVIDAIEEAQTTASTPAIPYTAATDRGDGQDAITTTDVTAPAAVLTIAASLDHSGPANIEPANHFDPSGAPVQSSGFDLDHASLDANPRANASVDQIRIDFNDPVKTGSEIVTEALEKQASA